MQTIKQFCFQQIMLTKFEKKKRILFGMKKQTHTKKNKNKKHGQSLKTQMIMIEYVG